MRKLLKRGASVFLIPLTRWYLRKKREYYYKGIKISVAPGVFHPGLFSSTKLLLKFLENKSLQNSTFLELGCGSGLISIHAARSGAIVTASDLSLIALQNARENATQNKLNVEFIHSDLFDSLCRRIFDWIIINPPYYAHAIRSEEQLAWHCGENYEYFEKLFSTLKEHIHPNTSVVMVIALGSELKKIKKIAEAHKFQMALIQERHSLFDGKEFLYLIQSTGD